MPGTFFGLDTALRGLEAQQTAIDIVGHNIANATTPGYSRQTVQMQATDPFSNPSMPAGGAGQIGTGVDISSITRGHDDFVQQQTLYQNQAQNQQQTLSDSLDQISNVFNEPSNQGFSSLLTSYFSSWQQLANNPSDSPSRAVVVANGVALAAGFNTAANALSAQQIDQNKQVSTYVAQINTIAGQIAGLNQQITAVVGVGQQPNDLMDKRDNLVNQLSQIANIQYTRGSNGAANISLTGAGALVQGTTSYQLTTVPNPTNSAFFDVAFQGQATHLSLSGGQLGGAITARDVTIAKRMSALDGVANNLMTAVNYYQTTGYDRNGTLGTPFFTGTSAATMKVSATVQANPALVAAATTVASPGVPNPEDGSNALNMSKLQESPFVASPPAQTETLQSQYQDIVSQLGVEAQQTKISVQTGAIVLQNLSAQQSSVSAVSLNEEASNLLQYQNAYQAATRVISIINQSISEMIQQLG